MAVVEDARRVANECRERDWTLFVDYYRRATGDCNRYAHDVCDLVKEYLLDMKILGISSKGYFLEKEGVPFRIFGTILGSTVKFRNEIDAKNLADVLGEGFSFIAAPTS